MDKLAIIGTAGRREDQGLLTKVHYQRMIDACIKFINHKEMNQKTLELYSGGAAWSDHLAVALVIKGVVPPSNLRLFLPAKLEYYGFEGENEYQQRVADTANYYHKLFSKTIEHNSIDELREVEKQGAILDVIPGGFKARNSKVAQYVNPDGHLLAFTFGELNSKQPIWTIRSFPGNVTAKEAGLKDGGTADTFNKTKSFKHHARLGPISPDYLTI